MVFILGRMGNITSALDLLITQLKDVKQVRRTNVLLAYFNINTN